MTRLITRKHVYLCGFHKKFNPLNRSTENERGNEDREKKRKTHLVFTLSIGWKRGNAYVCHRELPINKICQYYNEWWTHYPCTNWWHDRFHWCIVRTAWMHSIVVIYGRFIFSSFSELHGMRCKRKINCVCFCVCLCIFVWEGANEYRKVFTTLFAKWYAYKI